MRTLVVLFLIFLSACGQAQVDNNLSSTPDPKSPQKSCVFIETVQNMTWPPESDGGSSYVQPETAVYQCTLGDKVCTEYRHQSGWGYRYLEDCD
jgi:hypothetical protein